MRPYRPDTSMYGESRGAPVQQSSYPINQFSSTTAVQACYSLTSNNISLTGAPPTTTGSCLDENFPLNGQQHNGQHSIPSKPGPSFYDNQFKGFRGPPIPFAANCGSTFMTTQSGISSGPSMSVPSGPSRQRIVPPPHPQQADPKLPHAPRMHVSHVPPPPPPPPPSMHSSGAQYNQQQPFAPHHSLQHNRRPFHSSAVPQQFQPLPFPPPPPPPPPPLSHYQAHNHAVGHHSIPQQHQQQHQHQQQQQQHQQQFESHTVNHYSFSQSSSPFNQSSSSYPFRPTALPSCHLMNEQGSIQHSFSAHAHGYASAAPPFASQQKVQQVRRGPLSLGNLRDGSSTQFHQRAPGASASATAPSSQDEETNTNTHVNFACGSDAAFPFPSSSSSNMILFPHEAGAPTTAVGTRSSTLSMFAPLPFPASDPAALDDFVPVPSTITTSSSQSASEQHVLDDPCVETKSCGAEIGVGETSCQRSSALIGHKRRAAHTQSGQIESSSITNSNSTCNSSDSTVDAPLFPCPQALAFSTYEHSSSFSSCSSSSSMIARTPTREDTASVRVRDCSVLESPKAKATFQTWHKHFWNLARSNPKHAYATGIKYLSEAPLSMRWRVCLEVADLARRHNRCSQARLLYQTALHLDPRASQVYLEYAKLEEESGELESSLQIMEQALQWCEPDETLLIKTMKQHEKMNQIDAARAVLSRAAEMRLEKSWRILIEGALMEARVGSEHTARRVFKYLIENVHWYGPVYAEAARFEENRENFERAEIVANQGITACPRYGPLWLTTVRLALRRAVIQLATLNQSGRDSESFYTVTGDQNTDGHMILPSLTWRMPVLRTGLHADTISRIISPVRALLDRTCQHINQELLWKVHIERANLEKMLGNFDEARAAHAQALLTCPTSLRWKVWTSGARLELDASIAHLTHLQRTFDAISLSESSVSLSSSAREAHARAPSAGPSPTSLSAKATPFLPSFSSQSFTPATSSQTENASLPASLELPGLKRCASAVQASKSSSNLSATALPFDVKSNANSSSSSSSSSRVFRDGIAVSGVNHMLPTPELTEISSSTSSASPFVSSSASSDRVERSAVDLLRAVARCFETSRIILDRALDVCPAKMRATIVVEKAKSEELIGFITSGVQTILCANFSLSEKSEEGADSAFKPASWPNSRELSASELSCLRDEVEQRVMGFSNVSTASVNATAWKSALKGGTQNEGVNKADFTDLLASLFVVSPLQSSRKTARALLESALLEPGGDWKVHVESIFLELRAGDKAAAVAEAERALERHSGTGRLWALLTALKQDEGFTAQMDTFRRAIQETPKSGEVWCEGARICLNPTYPCFNIKAAMQLLRFALHFTPQYGDTFVELLRVKMLMHGPDHEAIERLQASCINTDPNYGIQWNAAREAGPSPTVRGTFRNSAIRVLAELQEYSSLYQRAIARSFSQTHDHASPFTSVLESPAGKAATLAVHNFGKAEEHQVCSSFEEKVSFSPNGKDFAKVSKPLAQQRFKRQSLRDMFSSAADADDGADECAGNGCLPSVAGQDCGEAGACPDGDDLAIAQLHGNGDAVCNLITSLNSPSKALVRSASKSFDAVGDTPCHVPANGDRESNDTNSNSNPTDTSHNCDYDNCQDVEAIELLHVAVAREANSQQRARARAARYSAAQSSLSSSMSSSLSLMANRAGADQLFCTPSTSRGRTAKRRGVDASALASTCSPMIGHTRVLLEELAAVDSACEKGPTTPASFSSSAQWTVKPAALESPLLSVTHVSEDEYSQLQASFATFRIDESNEDEEDPALMSSTSKSPKHHSLSASVIDEFFEAATQALCSASLTMPREQKRQPQNVNASSAARRSSTDRQLNNDALRVQSSASTVCWLREQKASWKMWNVSSFHRMQLGCIVDGAVQPCSSIPEPLRHQTANAAVHCIVAPKPSALRSALLSVEINLSSIASSSLSLSSSHPTLSLRVLTSCGDENDEETSQDKSQRLSSHSFSHEYLSFVNKRVIMGSQAFVDHLFAVDSMLW